MSIINQMLQKLEQRRGGDASRTVRAAAVKNIRWELVQRRFFDWMSSVAVAGAQPQSPLLACQGGGKAGRGNCR
jgi:hypothetical protein